MSIESAKAFNKRMKTDEEFAKKIMEKTTIDSRMALIHAEGFNLTVQEMEQAASVLTDDELEQVVGGAINFLPNLTFK
jgi:predicted ribosomally synthesized peptide with nif11-like leader